MKKFLLGLIFIPVMLNAQDTTLAKQQLESIVNNKALEITREEEAKAKGGAKPEKAEVKTVKPADKKNVERHENKSKNNILPIILFIAGNVILTGSVVIYYLRKKKGKPNSKELKRNIKLMREEKIGSFDNPKLTKVRTGLLKMQFKPDREGIVISTLAKKLSISKGEVHLAAKMKLLAGAER